MESKLGKKNCQLWSTGFDVSMRWFSDVLLQGYYNGTTFFCIYMPPGVTYMVMWLVHIQWKVETVHLHWHHAAYLTFPRSLWNYKCIICLQIPPWRSSPRNHISVSVPITHRLCLWTVSRCLHLVRVTEATAAVTTRLAAPNGFSACVFLKVGSLGRRFHKNVTWFTSHHLMETATNRNCTMLEFLKYRFYFLRRNCGGKAATDTHTHTHLWKCRSLARQKQMKQVCKHMFT